MKMSEQKTGQGSKYRREVVVKMVQAGQERGDAM